MTGDENTVVNQPQPSSESNNYDSFLGVESSSVESVSEQNPEPIETQTEDVQQVEAESELEQETQQDQETEQTIQDEWFNSLTPEEHAYYAKRYPTLYNAYQSADQPADLKAAFKDRVNQDRNWAAERQQRAVKVTEEEPNLQNETQTAADPTKQREQYQQFVSGLVEQYVDPAAVNELGKGLLEAFGVDTSKADDPEVKALLDNAPKVGQTLARGAADLLTTLLPAIIDRAVETRYPGFTEMHSRTAMMQSWEAVRTKEVENPDGTVDTPFANLPAFGTKEFKTELRRAAAEYAGSAEEFDAMVFRGQDGRPLPMHQQNQKKYEILARVIAGKKVDPQVVQTAVSTGKRLAAEQNNKLNQGKALGAGRSSRTLDTGKDESPLRKGFKIFQERDQNIFSRS